MRRCQNWMLAATICLGALAAVPAEAGVVIVASSGAVSLTADDSAQPGFAFLSGDVGKFRVSVAGVGAPPLTPPELQDLAVQAVLRNGPPASLTITLTQTDLAGIAGFGDYTAEFTGLARKAAVTRSIWVDPANLGLRTLLIGSTASPFDEKLLLNVPLTGRFALVEEVVINATAAGGLVSIDDVVSAGFRPPNDITRVAEPVTPALLGAVLVGLGLLRYGSVPRRRVVAA